MSKTTVRRRVMIELEGTPEAVSQVIDYIVNTIEQNRSVYYDNCLENFSIKEVS